MDDLNKDLVNKLNDILEQGISKDALKAVTKSADEIIERITDNVLYNLKDNLASELSCYVNEMAEKTVREMLNGNEDQMRHYLGCKNGYWTGRSDSPEYGRKREAHEWHSVIHGKLFEQGSIAIRKAVVDANADLLKNERILDLEDQVKSLVAQVNKANAEKDAMWERLRAA